MKGMDVLPPVESRASNGDRRERDFDAFVLGASGRLLRTAELLTGDRGRAEDLVQDAFARAYLRWDGIEAQDPIGYVRRCVLNGYTDWWRRRPWREQLTESIPEGAGRADPAEHLASQDAVHRALDSLTRKERAVVVLRYYDDLSELQIADLLDVAPGTVKSTSARALAKLRASAHLRTEQPPTDAPMGAPR